MCGELETEGIREVWFGEFVGLRLQNAAADRNTAKRDENVGLARDGVACHLLRDAADVRGKVRRHHQPRPFGGRHGHWGACGWATWTLTSRFRRSNRARLKSMVCGGDTPARHVMNDQFVQERGGSLSATGQRGAVDADRWIDGGALCPSLGPHRIGRGFPTVSISRKLRVELARSSRCNSLMPTTCYEHVLCPLHDTRAQARMNQCTQ